MRDTNIKWRNKTSQEDGKQFEIVTKEIANYTVCLVRENNEIGVAFCAPGDRKRWTPDHARNVAFSNKRDIYAEAVTENMTFDEVILFASMTGNTVPHRVIEQYRNCLANVHQFIEKDAPVKLYKALNKDR